MTNKRLGKKGNNSIGVSFFVFDGISGKDHGKYVQAYCEKIDAMNLSDDQREAMRVCMVDVYRLILEMFDEAHKNTKNKNIHPQTPPAPTQ